LLTLDRRKRPRHGMLRLAVEHGLKSRGVLVVQLHQHVLRNGLVVLQIMGLQLQVDVLHDVLVILRPMILVPVGERAERGPANSEHACHGELLGGRQAGSVDDLQQQNNAETYE
jgi:hypothetical protein